ncbi:cell division protein FtsQ/DivIB [Lactiplantibacillus modestisalitolerans]|uniref:Cell division protein DivIB n=1 Tax=Lactiplantibacillus modestisalitolerans TaxID=1457219 RepID=A0ABV5WTG2_9LACO|nr:cell division protein FtsQ/DivIB [Lactiplantibacillus modestisalitolerans]
MSLFKRKPKRTSGSASLTPWERYQQDAADNAATEKKRHFSWSGKRIRIGDKLPRLKSQRRRLVVKRAALLIGAFTVGLLIAAYFISPLSHIQRVTIRGTQQLSTAQVQTATRIRPGEALWAVIGHDRQISHRAQRANPQIERVETRLVGVNQVRVTVKEIRIAGYLTTGNSYQRVLENGVIMPQRFSQPSGGSPIYAHFKSGQRLQTMIKQYAKLPAKVKHAISEIKFAPNQANPERVHLYMNDGNEVYATISTFASKMTYYPGIVAKMDAKGIVNLEVGAYSVPFKSQNN